MRAAPVRGGSQQILPSPIAAPLVPNKEAHGLGCRTRAARRTRGRSFHASFLVEGPGKHPRGKSSILLKDAKLEILEVWLLLLLLALPSLFQPQEPQPIILDLQQGFPHLYLQDLRCPHKKCTLVE